MQSYKLMRGLLKKYVSRHRNEVAAMNKKYWEKKIKLGDIDLV